MSRRMARQLRRISGLTVEQDSWVVLGDTVETVTEGAPVKAGGVSAAALQTGVRAGCACYKGAGKLQACSLGSLGASCLCRNSTGASSRALLCIHYAPEP